MATCNEKEPRQIWTVENETIQSLGRCLTSYPGGKTLEVYLGTETGFQEVIRSVQTIYVGLGYLVRVSEIKFETD